ncbi:hypothetical protein OAK18_01000 [Candidatus Pelagibacter sp.]|nr:hypothetical protein [Candidatus Pelagibacter sp.]
MGLKLHRYINFNNKKFSVRFFNQRLPFIYILFNFLYRKFVVNPNINDKEISQFHKSGFTKIDISLKKEIEEYKDKFFINDENQKDTLKKVPLELNEIHKKDLATKIKRKLSPIIKKLEKYFNCDVFISDIEIWRNYNHNDTLNLGVSHFGNHFHQDSYTMTYSKIFVNLMDINEDDGPLEVIPREKRNSFIKSFNYKDMDNYNLFGDKTLIKKNVGKIGDCCLFSSSQIFHRAGVPKNYRDNMQIILVTIPKKLSEELHTIDNEKLFEKNYEYFQKFTKPYSIIKVIRLFFILFKYKLNA